MILKRIKIQLLRWFAWVSQTINTFLLLGHHDMTISARCYINRNEKGWRRAYKVVNGIFFWQEDHCRNSFHEDVKFSRQIIENYEDEVKK